MRASIYFSRKEIREYLEKRDYSICTLRRILIKEFKFKNTNDILCKIPNISKGVLDLTIASENKYEYDKILLLVSDIIRYLDHEYRFVNRGRMFGKELIYIVNNHIDMSKRRDSLYEYTEIITFKRILKKEMQEKLGLYEFGIAI